MWLGKTASTAALSRSRWPERRGTRCVGSGIAVEAVDLAEEGTISSQCELGTCCDPSHIFKLRAGVASGTKSRLTLHGHEEIFRLNLDTACVQLISIGAFVYLGISPLYSIQGCFGTERLNDQLTPMPSWRSTLNKNRYYSYSIESETKRERSTHSHIRSTVTLCQPRQHLHHSLL